MSGNLNKSHKNSYPVAVEYLGEDFEAAILALRDFDQERRSVYGQLVTYADTILSGEHDYSDEAFSLEISLLPLEHSTRKLMRSIFYAPNSFEEKVDLIAHIFFEDVKERAQHMRDYTYKSNEVYCFTLNNLRDCVIKAIELSENEQPGASEIDLVTDFYCFDMLNDIAAFLKAFDNERYCDTPEDEALTSEEFPEPELESKPEPKPEPKPPVPSVLEQPRTRSEERILFDLVKARLGEHALDIMKVAAGASLALFAKRLARHQP